MNGILTTKVVFHSPRLGPLWGHTYRACPSMAAVDVRFYASRPSIYAAEVSICNSTVVVVSQGAVRGDDVTIWFTGERKLISRRVL